jgi:hypothetical protein
MLPVNNGVLPPDKRKLLNLYDQLGEADRHALFAFVEFLAQRQGTAEAQDGKGQEPVGKPIEIPRPAEETVIGAIKRLSRSYHMIDRSAILTETSSLMTAHLVHGRETDRVIDELETLFFKAYSEQFGEQ